MPTIDRSLRQPATTMPVPMHEITLQVEPASAANVAEFGHLVAARPDVRSFANWPGVQVFGAIPIAVDDGAELLVVRMAARSFPRTVGLIERHPLHTQVYLPFNGKPFVMVLGQATVGRLPDFGRLRAFLFADASGIALHANIWHEFPVAIEDDTQFAVVLRTEAHLDTLEDHRFPGEAEGPDLERRATANYAIVNVVL